MTGTHLRLPNGARATAYIDGRQVEVGVTPKTILSRIDDQCTFCGRAGHTASSCPIAADQRKKASWTKPTWRSRNR